MDKKIENSLLVFYDGWCPLCQKAKKKMERADKHNRIKFISFRKKEVFEKYELDVHKVEERIYSIDILTSKSFSGIYTILQIVKRLPKYRMLVPLLYMSIILGFGQKVYDYIANKRNIVPVGQCDEDGCPIHKSEHQEDVD